MAYNTIAIEGGLFSPDLIEQFALGEGTGQKPGDFELTASQRLQDEFQDAFSSIRLYSDSFRRQRLYSNEGITTDTRKRWMIPTLERLGFRTLQYEQMSLFAGGDSFNISHRIGDDEFASPVNIVGIGQPIGTKSKGQRRSAHATVQEYLNRSDALWGMVTNGETIRLLRDTTRISHPTYAEFEIAPMIKENLYNEFTVLYRMLHRSRFPKAGANPHECFLEEWYQENLTQGNRVREHLREGVEAALEALGNGFVAHRENATLRDALASGTLTPANFYRQLLRLVYRLLFLFTVEERRLVLPRNVPNAERQTIYTQFYSAARLRDRCERPFADDRYTDLWPGLCRTFTLFRDDNAARALGMAALGGELFDGGACAALEAATCTNADLLKAIYRLSTFEAGKTRRRVNYAALDVEELGSVYESLLEYRPHLTFDPPRFELAHGLERKSTGSYYTPRSLVGELIESALVPTMNERVAAKRTPTEKVAAILDMRVCDPASGSGHFLLAAARRMAREVAILKSGEGEPSPEEYRAALREVVRQCIYAVDRNPLAVELCKVALWIESSEAGKSNTFLDHHVKCGDSLVGVFDKDAIERGIPDDAFLPKQGDDKKYASGTKKINKRENTGQQALNLQIPLAEERSVVDAFFHQVSAPILDASDHTARRHAYKQHRHAMTRRQRRLLADVWTAAFYWPLRGDTTVPPTTDRLRRFGRDPHLTVYETAMRNILPDTNAWRIMRRAATIAKNQRFFHWFIEFPEIAERGGFDVVFGNPPWERIKIQEQEFFAERDPEIARAANRAARQELIVTLPERKPALAKEFAAAQHDAEAQSGFLRTSGRFPLAGRGDINMYAVFAEQMRRLLAPQGRVGMVVPSGIATDDTTKQFFGDLVTHGSIASLYDFENRLKIFSAVDSRMKFSLFTMAGAAALAEVGKFAFFLHREDELKDPDRVFNLAPEDFALLNPNTRTCPIFRTARDAAITKDIYRRVSVLVNEAQGDDGDPWGVRFATLFHMSNDSHLFRTRKQLEAQGWQLDGNVFTHGDERYLPLYEAKLLHQFDHRWATYDGADARDLTPTEHEDPSCVVLSRYWVPEAEVAARLKDKWHRSWLLGWRNICRNTDERTVIATCFPIGAVGHSTPLFFPKGSPSDSACLLANLSALVFDYVTRQKLGGTNLTFGYMYQLPMLSPAAYNALCAWSPGETVGQWIAPRVLELVYTAHDMTPFARDMGYDGPPFAWEPERRFALRCELDAAFFHLYGVGRDDAAYILDTFPIVRKNDEKRHSEYRTKRMVLERYDEYATMMGQTARGVPV